MSRVFGGVWKSRDYMPRVQGRGGVVQKIRFPLMRSEGTWYRKADLSATVLGKKEKMRSCSP